MALEPAEMRDDESTFGGTAICDGNSSGKDLVSVSVGWSIKSHVGILPYPSNVKCAGEVRKVASEAGSKR